MLASEFNPKVQRGGTFSIGITATDKNNVPRDWSIYDSMRIQVRPSWIGKPGSIKDEPLLSLSTATGEIIVDTTLITITMSAARTETLSFNSGKYELEMIIDADGETPEIVDKLLYGIMYVTGEVVV